MKYLLDTHTLVWALSSPEKLSSTAHQIISSGENEIIASAISFWELSLKHALGKIQLNYPPEDYLKAARITGFQIIALEPEICSGYHQLKGTYHRDHFGRMLIWQAIQQDFTLISYDETIKKYAAEGLRVLW